MRRRRSKASAARAVAASRPVPSRPPGDLLDTLLGGRRSSAAPRPSGRRSAVGAGAGVAAWGGFAHPLDADGVLGHHQVPAGLDQPGQLELAAVGLVQALVELVDLLVATAVAEVPLGDVPEVVVVAVLGRRHRVDLVADQVLLLGDLVGGAALSACCCRRRGVVRGLLLRTAAAHATSRRRVLGRRQRRGAPDRRSPRPGAAAPTRARASFWSGPPSGTGCASPPRRAAAISTTTQTTKNSHASQTTNSSRLSRVVKVSWPVRVSLVGQRRRERVGAGQQPQRGGHPDHQGEQGERRERAAAAAERLLGAAACRCWKRPGSVERGSWVRLAGSGLVAHGSPTVPTVPGPAGRVRPVRCRARPLPRRAPGSGPRTG